MHADRGVEVGIGLAEDRRHRAAGGEAGDEDPVEGMANSAATAAVRPAMIAGSPVPRAWSFGRNQFQQAFGLSAAVWPG